MKKILSFSLAAFSLLLTSCFKQQQPEKININYYICGNIVQQGADETFTSEPVIYMNSDMKRLSTDEAFCFVNDITVTDNDTYAAGYYLDEDFQKCFKFWKNGESHLPLLKAKGEISKITFVNNKLYALGTIMKDDVSYGVILEDGNIIYECADEDSHFDVFGTNGYSFLIAGSVGNEGVYWLCYREKENDKFDFKKTTVMKKDDCSYTPSDITGTYSLPVISWNEFNGKELTNTGCFSVGQSITTMKEKDSYLNSICVYNGQYLSGGYVVKDNERKAYNWIGNEANEYGKTLTGNHYVFKCIYDGNLLHFITVVEKESNIYFDVSGMSGYGSFKMPVKAGFQPTSIFITYTKESTGAIEL